MHFSELFLKSLGIKTLCLQDATEDRLEDPKTKRSKMTKLRTPLILAGKDNGYYGGCGYKTMKSKGRRSELIGTLRNMSLEKFLPQLKKSGFRGFKPKAVFKEVVAHYLKTTQNPDASKVTVRDLFEFYKSNRGKYRKKQFNLFCTVHPKEVVVGS